VNELYRYQNAGYKDNKT